MFKKLLLIFIIVSILPFTVSAQSVGKIAGMVFDQATGEPLPGVNIIVDKTVLGANSDLDGYFVILNVPVGVYTVRAVYIGFQEVAVEEARVSAGITTDINFDLKEATLELGEVIVITGARPLVEKNVTQSYSLVTSDQIEVIPVRGLQNILALQASVVLQDGQLHIRGGRQDEVGYYLDGASTLDPVTNTNAVYVIQEAVEEMQVLAGGYTAEFGGANSGIIRAELKTGKKDYQVTLDFQTDKFTTRGEEFLGTKSFNDHLLIATFSGPVVSDRVRLFVAFENNYEGDNMKRYSEAFRFDESNLSRPLIDYNPDNPAKGDTVDFIQYPGYTPHNKRNRYTVNSTLLFDFSPIQFRLSALFNQREYTTDDIPMLNVLNDRHYYYDARNLLLSGKLTHVLNPKTFYDVGFSYFDDFVEKKDDYFGNDWRAWSDSAKIAQHTNGDVIYRDEDSAPYDYLLNGFYFNRNGALNNAWYYKEKQTYFSGAVNITSQINRFNEVKAGFDIRSHTVRRFDIWTPTALNRTLFYGREEAVPEAAWKEALGSRTYGYDRFGNELDSGIDAAKKPLFASFYIQDKIEFEDLIINAGLRYDYFDTDDKDLINPSNPDINEDEGIIEESAWEDKEPFQFLSPRLGISFPISEKTVFYTQYGSFVQTPKLSHIYRSYRELGTQIVTGGNYYLAPIGYGAEPIKTTSYEIGFRQQIGEVASIDITGFYKNLKGQMGIEKVQAAPAALISTYEVLTNGDFATTKGIEFRLHMRRYKGFQAQFNYTYTSAEGTGSGEVSYHAANYNDTQKPTITSPLDYNRDHKGTLNLDYRFYAESGPILSDFGANVLWSFSSGHPYTNVYFSPGGQVNAYNAGVDYMNDTRSREALEPINSSTTPWITTIDLRLDKTFRIMDIMQVMVYMRVTNLLDTKNVINVFQATGSAQDDGFISDPIRAKSFVTANGGQDYLDMYNTINLKNGQAYWDAVGLQLYGTPRQIWFGIKLIY